MLRYYSLPLKLSLHVEKRLKMAQYTTDISKQDAIKIVVACADKYNIELKDKTLLFLCIDKHYRISYLECSFSAINYLHLTGLKVHDVDDGFGNKHTLSASDFYEKCITHHLSINDFEFAKDGTTPLKLAVLSHVISKNLSANTIGNFNSATPLLRTDKLVGSVTACMGFINIKGRFIPNTVLNKDIRDYINDSVRIIATFRKNTSDAKYSELTYKAKKVDWERVVIPKNVEYLGELL